MWLATNMARQRRNQTGNSRTDAGTQRRKSVRSARKLSRFAVQGEGAALGTGVVAALEAGDGERIGGTKPVATTAAWNWCSTTLESAGMGFGSMG